MPDPSTNVPEQDRQERILGAVLSLLSRGGISAVSMRAVAREAGVSLGLVNYYYEDKTSLIRAALRRIEEQDIAIVEPDLTLDPVDRLRAALKRVASPEYLTTEYLSLRLQLWALAPAHDTDRRFAAAAGSLLTDPLVRAEVVLLSGSDPLAPMLDPRRPGKGSRRPRAERSRG